MRLLRQEVRQMAGEVLVCGFPGPQVDAEVREIVRELQPSGLIAFARNVQGVEAVAHLNAELKALRPQAPLMLSVDQEGGRVARLREGVTRWPPMAALGRCAEQDAAGATRLAHDVGAALGREVRALGFDLDYAPVLDVATNPNNPIIGDRALAATPERTAALGAAMVRGMQGMGVAACGKHFPGHGDTDADSHLTLPALEHDPERFAAVEWPPFAAAIAAGVSTLMTAHVHAPALDAGPATLSHAILTDVLRGKLGFRGIILSDDIDMKGLADHVPAEEVGPRGLLAGVDMFLACKDVPAMFALYRGIVRAAEDGSLPHARLADAARRARALHQRYWQPAAAPKLALAALAEATERHHALAAQLHQIWDG